jgi:hypothetical protein
MGEEFRARWTEIAMGVWFIIDGSFYLKRKITGCAQSRVDPPAIALGPSYERGDLARARTAPD